MTTTQTDTAAGIDPRTLAPGDFTASDRARLELAITVKGLAQKLGDTAAMLAEALAVAGDYARRARILENTFSTLIDAAVVAERVRGTGWEQIGKPFYLDAAGAEKRWGGVVERWNSETRATSIYIREPQQHVPSVDRFLMEGARGFAGDQRRPLTPVLDAAAALTGRDVAAADRAFAGTEVCEHCHR
ncbi:hypothetical protein ACWEO1_37000 [Kitasatospora cineracea]